MDKVYVLYPVTTYTLSNQAKPASQQASKQSTVMQPVDKVYVLYP